jgi:group II intron reverse transcriptase/maturase
MSIELYRISELAKKIPRQQFTSIAHFLSPLALNRAFENLNKNASAGVDGVTHKEYQKDAWGNILKLHNRLKNKQYRAQPLRRTYIPKENGKQRPISIPSLEDKIVQGATVELLNAIYEQDFLNCSYGFRPGRGQHDALDEIDRIIFRQPISYVLEADITGYFDSIVREKLMELIEKRVRDGSILRLIRKWINLGYIDEGQLLLTETGTGQGQIISPLLSNIYLHYVLDEWFENEVKPLLKGEAYEIRYADDFILCFQYREDAERVLRVLSKRFAKFGLSLHPEKTRLIEFGRQAKENAMQRGEKKPATFDFLGFTHFCAKSRNNKFTIHLKTMRKRLRRSLAEISDWCKKHRHDSIPSQCAALNQKLRGHYGYYGRPTNYRSLWRFFRIVRYVWRKWLSRRTRGKPINWDIFTKILQRNPLLHPWITRPWASKESHA